ncbi:sensor histidine kinase [Paraburkholderia caribensis]|uniref:sensor histidine kinase n=1 Tax=Paraburkholderia caribensis TaxID=75105 RepID=UPI0007218ADF|nr:HAMP domain-containing sensor histidine kinase [Paraburkholderia caribensis]ALP66106.1 histidine kinase [Paraburkholderia caribensis]AMV45891.1 histidine kinase [Paraburkholderia caribensis]AUT55976.1 sensor histidine kinase [Paraburkholderia caribensis]CAG9221519.1 Sensory histidine kinase QseC [Paraburkholderia caribensis]
MKSLKSRIIGTLIVLFAVVGLADAGASYWLTMRHIDELLDVHLQGAAVWLAAGKVGTIGTNGPPQHSIDGFVGQIWKQGLSTPTDNTDPEVIFNRNAPGGYSVERINGHRYRIYTLRKSADDLTYQVGQPVAFREQSAGRAALESLVPTFFLILLVWFAIPMVVNTAFASLERASSDAEAVGIGHLTPLDISHAPEEVKPFADSINRMIARLQIGIEGEKRFIADAAHELRTPIAVLQLRIDNLENAPDATARAERTRELREAIVRTATMIRQLLELARADAQRDPDAVDDAIDLRQMVQTLVADLLPVSDARLIDLGVKRFEAVHLHAHAGELRMAVRNLIENALRYTPAGGCIDIDVFADATNAVVRITDTGPGIPEDALDRVFDRFFRLKSETVEGTGLGLSIVKSVVEKHGGSISLENRRDGQSGLIATLVLPLRPSPGN